MNPLHIQTLLIYNICNICNNLIITIIIIIIIIITIIITDVDIFGARNVLSRLL
jgi:hypothetical protein